MSRLRTLDHRGHELASPIQQIGLLESLDLSEHFGRSMAGAALHPLRPTCIEILQLNVGRVCNQVCAHCHVDAGPDRSERMSDAVLDRCLEIFETSDIGTIDITGGAPELHPRFAEMIERCGRLRDRRVIHRCNLTAIMAPPLRHLAQVLADNDVEIVASLPHFKSKQTDRQRGDGVLDKSIACLQRFNELGYGQEGSGKILDLVTNPVGAFLPGSQQSLEREFRRELRRRYGVEFNRLLVLTNMPIARYLEFLVETDNLTKYMTRLVNAFNPAAAAAVMCRNTISIGYDGALYDCDFNQMLALKVDPAAPQTVSDWDRQRLESRSIVVNQHCYGCTAGAGSSCGGQTA